MPDRQAPVFYRVSASRLTTAEEIESTAASSGEVEAVLLNHEDQLWVGAGSDHTDREVDDLHALLAAANVDGPYVLVGHSYGGMVVRVYAAAYPHDVAGLVLLDSAHPDQDRRFSAALQQRRRGQLRDLRRCTVPQQRPESQGRRLEAEHRRDSSRRNARRKTSDRRHSS